MGKTFVEDERPCDSCVNVTRYGCVSWNCEYINRDEAIKAWRVGKERVMTNEEAKTFLDNLKVCIEEHPIVADWLVEIADRKTEPQTCSVNGRPYDCGNCEYHKCMADEPQTERR